MTRAIQLFIGLYSLMVLLLCHEASGQFGHFGEQCVAAGGGVGTCVSAAKCVRLRGKARGFCSLLGEVCCETSLQCNQASQMKRIVLSSDQLAQTQVVTSCSYTIQAFSANVCQLLVEFEKFDLGQPSLSADGDASECRNYMRVGKFILCGRMDRQHLYVPYQAATTITVSFAAQSTWHVTVTQLECPKQSGAMLPFPPTTGAKDYDQLAPWGCDQYFTATRGTIKSFNYNGASGTYLNGLNYVICVKTVGSQRIQYTLRHFALGSNTPGPNYNEGCKSTISTAGRSEDYLMIPQSSIVQVPHMQPLLYCGVMPANTKIIAEGPFIMYFSSDALTSQTEQGFSIDYAVM